MVESDLNNIVDVDSKLLAEMFVQALNQEPITFEASELFTINSAAISDQIATIDFIKAVDPESDDLTMILADLSLF